MTTKTKFNGPTMEPSTHHQAIHIQNAIVVSSPAWLGIFSDSYGVQPLAKIGFRLKHYANLN